MELVGTFNGLKAVLQAEVGYHEGRSGDHWNNMEKYAPLVPELSWAQGQPWCAVFTTWAYRTARVKEGTFAVTASVEAAMNWYKAKGRWSEKPSLGAQVIYGGHIHTGIVIAFDDTTITTIEGNTNDNGSAEGDGVYVKTRNRFSDFVTGYGSPDFDKPAPSAPVFPGRDKFVLGADNKSALQLQKWLAAIDAKIPGTVGPAYLVGPSTKMTKKDIAKVKALQQHFVKDLGPADGLTGPVTWRYAWELANGKRSW